MTTFTSITTECPRCGKKGKAVKPTTLRALLRPEFTAAVAIPEEDHCE
jgi:hypothetical protein